MTEREAWLYLAELWDSPDEENEDEVVVPCVKIMDETHDGLCDCIDGMEYYDMIPEWTAIEMRERIKVLPDCRHHYYKFTLDFEGSAARAAFCRSMAEKCEQATVKSEKSDAL